MNYDVYEKVTKRIIEQLEKGIIPWKRPWKICGTNIKGEKDLKNLAFNRISKTAYTPLNQMLLEKCGEYASFKQWTEIGGKIKKGAKSEFVVFWKLNTYERIDEETQEKQLIKIPILKWLPVFHIDDVENVKPLNFEDITPKKEFNSIQEAESLMLNYCDREKIRIHYSENQAYYKPFEDCINLPERFKFKNKAEFYSTAFHEIVHSTGHQTRLNRDDGMISIFGTEDYSKEELIAEIGSATILNMLNIETNSSFTNSVAYIQAWIKKLKNDNKLIISASSKAEKAVNFIITGEKERVEQ